jgi:hypothetical protein
VILVVSLELGFLFEKKFLDLPTFGRICSEFEHFLVFNFCRMTKRSMTFTKVQPPTLALELDQCSFV